MGSSSFPRVRGSVNSRLLASIITTGSSSKGPSMRMSPRLARSLAVVSLFLAFAPRGWTEDGAWVELTGLDAWKSPVEGWSTIGSAGLDPGNPKKLAVESGTGTIYNGPTGRAKNLISKETFGDVEMHI